MREKMAQEWAGVIPPGGIICGVAQGQDLGRTSCVTRSVESLAAFGSSRGEGSLDPKMGMGKWKRSGHAMG